MPAAPTLTDDPFDSTSERTIVVPRSGTATEWKLIDIDGTAYPLHRSNVLGRRPSGAGAPEQAQLVQLSDPGRVLSRTHARIDVNDGVIWVTDLGSTNGTDVIDASERVAECEPHQAHALEPGDSLSLGGRLVSFAGPER